MMLPWNMIYSQQKGAPGQGVDFRSQSASKKAATVTALSDAKKEKPTPRAAFVPPRRTVRKAAEKDSKAPSQAFTPWIIAEEAPAPTVIHKPDTPRDADNFNPPDRIPTAEIAAIEPQSKESRPFQEPNQDQIIKEASEGCTANDLASPKPSPRLIRRRRPRPIPKSNSGQTTQELPRDVSPETELSSVAQGFLYFKKWWFLRKSGVSVNGKMINGIPIIIRKNTLRVVNDAYSYLIPMKNVDYIRTCDGLRSIQSEFDDRSSPFCER